MLCSGSKRHVFYKKNVQIWTKTTRKVTIRLHNSRGTLLQNIILCSLTVVNADGHFCGMISQTRHQNHVAKTTIRLHNSRGTLSRNMWKRSPTVMKADGHLCDMIFACFHSKKSRKTQKIQDPYKQSKTLKIPMIA